MQIMNIPWDIGLHYMVSYLTGEVQLKLKIVRLISVQIFVIASKYFI